ncbi:unnamed protein product [Adineta steineri]|uniref:G-protein coupled receptors family 2 profile 2 domain-containing protein n=1 Tax=Adineta steineri TaxID=433720 RepID=A0A814Q196_9BILA|nr:unnamed protein product [Adineta steineri]CAF1177047.1 unnamed protein product [Adineta steineri]
MIVGWITFFLVILMVIPSSSLICFECICNFKKFCDCSNTIDRNDSTRCIIDLKYALNNSSIYLTGANHNSTYLNTNDHYYIDIKQSIIHNKKTKDWYTLTHDIIYSCDWNYCNDLKLINIFPLTIKTTINKAWLNKNIYGNGVVDKCHYCPKKFCRNSTYPIDFNQCPIIKCTKRKTCIMSSLTNNILTNEQCFHSECSSKDSSDESNDKDDEQSKIVLDIIIFLAQNRSKFSILKMDIFCTADNCSRPTIFQEIKEQISIPTSDLAIFPSVRPTTLSSTLTTTTHEETTEVLTTTTTTISNNLECYKCLCMNNNTCSCKETEQNSFETTHCIIVESFVNEEIFYTNLTHINQNSSQIYIQQFPYILIQQSIIYNKTLNDWISSTDFIYYGCNWHLCNDPYLISHLKNSVKISLNKSWLNINVLNNEILLRNCNECPNNFQCNSIDNLNTDECPLQKCNSTCFLSNIYNYGINNEQCYQSYCATSNNISNFENDLHPIIIQGILYLNRSNHEIELSKVNIPCHATDCSSLEIFQEIKSQLIVQLGDLSVFYGLIDTTTTVATTTTTTTTTITATQLSTTTETTTAVTTIVTTVAATTTTTTTTTKVTTTVTQTTTQYSTTTTTTKIPSFFYDQYLCNNSMLIPGLNGTCVPMIDAYDEAVDFLMNENNIVNVIDIANALSVYFGATASMDSFEQLNKTLTPILIDNLVGVLNISLIQNSSSSFIMCQSISKTDLVLGVSFESGVGGQIIENSTKIDLINSNLTAAAIISPDSLINTGITYINMLVIDEPPIEYYRLNNSNEKIVSSSIIVAKTQTINNQIISNMNITIYFTLLPNLEYNLTNGKYYCSFYDTNTSSWIEHGCTYPIFNSNFQRYECSCNHLTSFALVWLPKTMHIKNTKYFDVEDIISLIFQMISIICFLSILIHSLIKRRINLNIELEARDLLPLISCASTILVFIFYITLGLTVYTQTESLEENICFRTSNILMFIVYYLVIFMFCTKTSVGYFNYLRFVHPYPPPSLKRLRLLLISSFLISITYVSFAIGFNSNSSYHITILYPYKICWFTPNVIHYFLTIPICIFLLLNIIMIISVIRCLINHARNVIASDQSSKRLKMCVLVLLSSCVTQGISWLIGPLLSIINSYNVHGLTWIFVIFNGLEGVWSILLYIIIRAQRVDENARSGICETLTRSSTLSSDHCKKKYQQ